MARQHPVFVYGTLRPGQENYRRLLAGRTRQERRATARGLAIYGTGFPYAVRQPGAQTAGDLITIEPTLYREVLADLDALEGYHPQHTSTSHYIRVTKTVTTNPALPNGGTWEAFHTAWVYLAGPGANTTNMPRITGDDWLVDHRR